MLKISLFVTAAAIPTKDGIVFGMNGNLFIFLIFDKKKHMMVKYRKRLIYQKLIVYFTLLKSSVDIIFNNIKIDMQPVEIVDGKYIKSWWNLLGAKSIFIRYIKSKMVEHKKSIDRKI